MTRKILAARRHDRRMETAIEPHHHRQTQLAVVVGGHFPQSEPHPTRGQPPARMTARVRRNVPRVLFRVERDRHMGNMLQHKIRGGPEY